MTLTLRTASERLPCVHLLEAGSLTNLVALKSWLMKNPAFRAEYEKACVEYQALEAALAASASNQSRKIAAGSDRSVPDRSQ